MPDQMPTPKLAAYTNTTVNLNTSQHLSESPCKFENAELLSQDLRKPEQLNVCLKITFIQYEWHL